MEPPATLPRFQSWRTALPLYDDEGAPIEEFRSEANSAAAEAPVSSVDSRSDSFLARRQPDAPSLGATQLKLELPARAAAPSSVAPPERVEPVEMCTLPSAGAPDDHFKRRGIALTPSHHSVIELALPPAFEEAFREDPCV